MTGEAITDPEVLSRMDIRIGDLVTERVTDIGGGTDNGYYDGQVVRIEREAPTTPAPLDPALVKAGDTVTLEDMRAPREGLTVDPDWKLTGRVQEIRGTHFDADGKAYGWSVRIGHSPYHVGTTAEGYTLTAHTPAPEPEWEPGTTGTATVRGQKGVRVLRTRPHRGSYSWVSEPLEPPHLHVVSHMDSDVTDFVPLVVIDPGSIERSRIQAKISARLAGSRPYDRAAEILEMVLKGVGIDG